MKWIFLPTTPQEVTQFYLVWVGAYMAVHIVWDILSPHTDKFELHKLSGKVGTLFSAGTLASSLLLLTSLLDAKLFELLGSMTLPILLSGGAGVLLALSALSPNPPTSAP